MITVTDLPLEILPNETMGPKLQQKMVPSLSMLMCGQRYGAKWLPCITQGGATHCWWLR